MKSLVSSNTIHHYVIEKQYDAVKNLLGNGANVNERDGYTKTPLMYAAQLGHAEICGLLLEYNAQLNLQDNCDDTALVLAASNGYEVIVDMLLAAKADPTLPDGLEATIESFLPRKYDLLIAVFEKHGF